MPGREFSIKIILPMFNLRGKRQNKAQSIIEFAFLIVLILSTFLIFQRYITRGISGRWKSVGDALGNGRQWDPKLTTECAFDADYSTGVWYNKTCFDMQGCGEKPNLQEQ